MKKSVFFLLLALFLSALKNVQVPTRYDIKFGLQGHQQTVNNLIYFLGIDLILVCLMACIISLCTFTIQFIEYNLPASKISFQHAHTLKSFKIFSYGALWLAGGKVIDEFTSPYGYHAFELIYDLFIATCTAISLFRHTHNAEQ